METSIQARQSAEPASGGTPQQYLTFSLGGEAFAIGILAIKEIIELGRVTDVPMMPACVRGVINLRGAVVPVVDLAVRFGRAATVPTRRTCVVIVEVASADGPQVLGVMVDSVSSVVDIGADLVEPAPAFGTHLKSEFISGMGKVDGGFVIILDADKVLSTDDIGLPREAGNAGADSTRLAA